VYSLILIVISPNAASVLEREHICFNPAREGAAREQEGAAREQKKMIREQQGSRGEYSGRGLFWLPGIRL